MQIVQKTRHLKTLAIIMLLVGFLVGGFLIYYNNRSAQAADLKKFNAGNIISDSVFYNYSTMSASQIQDFLNSKVKSCNGDYTCLKDYRSSTVSKPVDSYCSGYNSSSSQSAAEIIYGVSQSCKINPQVLLVLLQKETGLVTHTGPGSWRYQTATGMGCPDTAACDSQYYGLFNQLYGAARQFKIYQAKPSNYRYVANRNNSIQWNPSASCGSTNVYIENQATAGLYNYTPYAPNQAALNAGYGTGNGCSSYGNRNFYLYFTDWFGTTAQTKLPDCNSKVPDVSCVWRLYNIYTRAEFLTINTAERDIAVKSGNWIFDGNAFYAYTKQVPGSTPIYRIYMPTQHFFTANSYERNVILSDKNNNDEGIAFYALPSTTVNNASYPVYRLYGNNGHFLNTSTSSFDNTYTREGVGFNAPSGAADAPQPSSGKENVYRLNGPEHFYTASTAEKDSLLKSGKWTDEGIAFYVDKSGSPVYRLNKNQHFYTLSNAEKDTAVKSGWQYEGVGWYIQN